MIEQALQQHLQAQAALLPFLANYGDKMAIFNQEAPSDKDRNWGMGPQYGRIVFAVDLQGDPERIMGGMLAVDILCKEDEQFPEEIEPVLRELIHGYFFSEGTFVVAAQWKNSSYFTEPTDKVTGCTVAFDLLAFPVITTNDPDVVSRINEWSSNAPNLYVINYTTLPASAWKPSGDESAIYWRVLRDSSAGWIRNSYATIWRTATIKGHIFSETPAVAATVARNLVIQLYAIKRLMKPGESPIMVNRNNSVDNAADPLRTGQVTVEGTYGIPVYYEPDDKIQHIHKDRKENL